MLHAISLLRQWPMDKSVVTGQSEVMFFAWLPLMLATALVPKWPDGVDASLTAFYLALFFGIPLLGYVVMVIDFRRYLRSLRRALVVVSQVVPVVPYWAILEQPGCLRTFGLKLPCTQEEVLAAYREQAKTMHPDRGGDLQQFLRLQTHFEQALKLVRDE
jgi:hypothetical protein